MEEYMKYPSQETPFKDIIHNNIGKMMMCLRSNA